MSVAGSGSKARDGTGWECTCDWVEEGWVLGRLEGYWDWAGGEQVLGKDWAGGGK